MAETVAKIIKSLSPIFPATFSNIIINLNYDGEVYHHKSGSGWRCASTGLPSVSMSITDLSKSKLCDLCLRAYKMSSLTRIGPLLSATFAVKEELKRSNLPVGEFKPELFQKQFNRLSNAIDSLNKNKSQFSKIYLDPDDEKRLSDFINEALCVKKEMSDFFSSTSLKDEILRTIKSHLVPLDHESFTFDESPTLVPFGSSVDSVKPANWTHAAKLVLKNFQVSSNPLVLKVPRFAADYLLLQPSSRAAGLHLPVNATGASQAVIDTAIKLFEPGTANVYRSFQAALEAAFELT